MPENTDPLAAPMLPRNCALLSVLLARSPLPMFDTVMAAIVAVVPMRTAPNALTVVLWTGATAVPVNGTATTVELELALMVIVVLNAPVTVGENR